MSPTNNNRNLSFFFPQVHAKWINLPPCSYVCVCEWCIIRRCVHVQYIGKVHLCLVIRLERKRKIDRINRQTLRQNSNHESAHAIFMNRFSLYSHRTVHQPISLELPTEKLQSIQKLQFK